MGYKRGKIKLSQSGVFSVRKDKKKICRILQTDKRFKGSNRCCANLFRDIYGITISRATIQKYKKELKIAAIPPKNNPAKQNKIQKLLREDKKLNCSSTKCKKLLKEVYNIDINPTTIRIYRRELGLKNDYLHTLEERPDIIAIIKKDTRLNCGMKKGKLLLKNIYNISVGRSAFSHYKKLAINQTQNNAK